MITEALLNVLFFVPTKLVGLMPALDISIPDGIFNGASSLLFGLGYFLPMASFAAILFTSFTFYAAKVFWAIILRVKSFIPTMGA